MITSKFVETHDKRSGSLIRLGRGCLDIDDEYVIGRPYFFSKVFFSPTLQSGSVGFGVSRPGKGSTTAATPRASRSLSSLRLPATPSDVRLFPASQGMLQSDDSHGYCHQCADPDLLTSGSCFALCLLFRVSSA